ncbi:hypothetical protein [Arthrobacter sp. HLT1-21]
MSTQPSEPSTFEQLQQRAIELAAEARRLEDLDAPSTQALVPTSTGIGIVPAQSVKAAAADQRVEVLRLQREMAATANALRAEYERQMVAMKQMMAPLEERQKQLGEVIQTVGLYLGQDEYILRLRGGKQAPLNTPITIRQMVLSMDEETAILVGDGGDDAGIDHMDVEKFDEWLLADDAHLNQIIPEQRGVVALVPRRRGKDYKDPWANAMRNRENQHTYWIIRNGDQISRMDTEFDVGANLVPTRDEFTGLFRTTRYDHALGRKVEVDLVPGSREWLHAEKNQGARQRHFMKVALILQGLIDRTKLFDPLPENVSFLHPESYAKGHTVMLADGEWTLTSNRKPFYAWLAELNSQLRPGMRFIGMFGLDDFRSDTYEHWRGYRYHARIKPKDASFPSSKVIHQIERREGDRFIFKYARTDNIWSGHEYGPAKTRASAYVYAHDRFIVPIDLVDIPTMRGYLEARTERHAYTDMFAILKQAILIKEQEQAAEAPFIAYLAAQVAGDLQITATDAEAGIRAVVDWWKLGNKWHRPLVKGEDPAAEAKAAAAIIKEFTIRHAGKANVNAGRDAVALSKMKDLVGDDLLLIGRRPSGTYLAFSRQPLKYGKDQGFREDVWVVEYSITKTGKVGAGAEWTLPGNRAAKTTPLYTADDWAQWETSTNPREFLTDAETDELIGSLESRVSTLCHTTGYQRYLNEPRTLRPKASIVAVTFDAEAKRIVVWVHSPELAEEQLAKATAEDMERSYLKFTAFWVKDAPGAVRTRSGNEDGVAVAVESRWYTKSFDDREATSRPWGLIFDGQSHDPRVVREYPDELAKLLEFCDAVDIHNGALRKRRELVRTYLDRIQRDSKAIEEEALRVRYMEDYRDTDGWEEHRKTLRLDGVSVHSRAYNVLHPLNVAVLQLVHGGATLDGATVRQVMSTAKMSAEDMAFVEEQGIAGFILKSTWD